MERVQIFGRLEAELLEHVEFYREVYRDLMFAVDSKQEEIADTVTELEVQRDAIAHEAMKDWPPTMPDGLAPHIVAGFVAALRKEYVPPRTSEAMQGWLDSETTDGKTIEAALGESVTNVLLGEVEDKVRMVMEAFGDGDSRTERDEGKIKKLENNLKKLETKWMTSAQCATGPTYVSGKWYRSPMPFDDGIPEFQALLDGPAQKDMEKCKDGSSVHQFKTDCPAMAKDPVPGKPAHQKLWGEYREAVGGTGVLGALMGVCAEDWKVACQCPPENGADCTPRGGSSREQCGAVPGPPRGKAVRAAAGSSEKVEAPSLTAPQVAVELPPSVEPVHAAQEVEAPSLTAPQVAVELPPSVEPVHAAQEEEVEALGSGEGVEVEDLQDEVLDDEEVEP